MPQNSENKAGSWRKVYIITTLSAYLYVFMEWLFIVTKPSFMSLISFSKKIEILFFSGAAVAILCLLVLLPLRLASLLIGVMRIKSWLIHLGLLVPAVILASLGLLMVDNFTYTIFQFGIISTHGVTRGLYAIFWLVLIFLAYRYLRITARRTDQPQEPTLARQGLRASLIGAILLSFLLPIFSQHALGTFNGISGQTGKQRLPHILFITSDGMEAAHLSLYGYERDTSPHLRDLAPSSLVAENNFTNSNVTAASIVSMYTSKYPAQSDFFYPPNILRGANAYEHLPGILHSLGYYNVQIAAPHFADAFTDNMLGGFDFANGQTAETSQILSTLNRYLSNDFAYFFYETGNRIFDRLRHIFYIKEMNYSRENVSNPETFNDRQKVNEVLSYFHNPTQPLFIHIHLLGTHGERFQPSRQVFSVGQAYASQGSWNPDFYDDSILDTDREVGKIVETLKGLNLWDNTILIVGADHGEKWTDTHRIPLLIHFPDGLYAGKLVQNTQNIDIAPTLLDYLDVAKPVWMSGQSLLHLPAGQRPIISNGPSNTIKGEDGWILDPNYVKPPFYELGVVNLVYCQKWYKLDLHTKQWFTGDVAGSTNLCPSQDLLSNKSALQLMLAHVKMYGYDTSSLNGFQFPSP